MKGTASYGTVAVGVSAVAIVDGTTGRGGVWVQNVHASQILYVGSNSSVATTTGFKIVAGASHFFEGYNGPLYGIASGADTDVRFFETGS